MRTTILSLLLLAVVVHSQEKKLFPDTTDGFHWFLVFDTPILLSEQAIDSKPYDLVWGASDRILPMYRQGNPDIVTALYIPWSRDNDGTHDLAWWQQFHPDWVLYQCDQRTPAYLADDPHMPLDIGNPDVIEWQLQKYSGMVHQFGYDSIAADNFATGNALHGCGIWKDGKWVQKYTGNWDDVAYNRDALAWVRKFYSTLHVISPDISFGINFSLNGASPFDPLVMQVTDSFDYVMDEAGFTNWGFYYTPPAQWNDIHTWIENIQKKGKHYFGINEFPELTRAGREWGMASYLMSKNDHSSMINTLVQGYGIETKQTEYDALAIGWPMGGRYLKDRVYFRQYSNGLAVVNPFNETATFTLPNNGWSYKDVLGNAYSSEKPITILGQTGIVMGATAKPPTTTITTARPTTTTTTTITSTTTTTTSTTIGMASTTLAAAATTGKDSSTGGPPYGPSTSGPDYTMSSGQAPSSTGGQSYGSPSTTNGLPPPPPGALTTSGPTATTSGPAATTSPVDDVPTGAGGQSTTASFIVLLGALCMLLW